MGEAGAADEEHLRQRRHQRAVVGAQRSERLDRKIEQPNLAAARRGDERARAAGGGGGRRRLGDDELEQLEQARAAGARAKGANDRAATRPGAELDLAAEDDRERGAADGLAGADGARRRDLRELAEQPRLEPAQSSTPPRTRAAASCASADASASDGGSASADRKCGADVDAEAAARARGDVSDGSE